MAIEVVAYSDEWPVHFERVRADLARALAGVGVVAIEHVGSTSVPGLAAKPVLDIDIVVRRDQVDAATRALEAMGYEHQGDLGLTDRIAFAAPDADPRRHVYVCVEGTVHLRNHLAVRDVLRRRPDLRDRYGAVKLGLVTDPAMDIDTYLAGKSAVLQEVLALSDLTDDERAAIFRLNTDGSTGLGELDELIANAWRPAEDERFGGWRYRWAHGVSRRANSALALSSDHPLDTLVAHGERFYAERGAPSTLLVSTASAPPALTSVLGERGYRSTAVTEVQHAVTREVLDRTAPSWRVELTDTPSDAWLRCYWSVESAHGRREADGLVVRDLLLAPRLPTRFATAFEGDDVAGVGQTVVEAGWAGVQCMATAPTHRRRGVAVSVLHALAADAAHAGIGRMYLAVMAENTGARRVYEAAGFTPSHGYRYFVR